VTGCRAACDEGSRSTRCPNERLEAVYPQRRGSAAEMRAALRTYLTRYAVDAGVVYEIVLAADEAFVNALTHSASGGEIRVSACVSRGAAEIDVHDEGDGFAHRTSHLRPVPDVSLTNGRGVFLIESMMDSVRVITEPDGTTVRMVRRLAPTPGTPT